MRIAILTSGGDCQGMNACLFSALKRAKEKKIELYKVMFGYEGLIDGKIEPFELSDILGKENLGGSCIKSSRSTRFFDDKFVKKSAKNLKQRGIDNLIILGGNGSIKGALDLQKYGIKCVCIPSTIDNDLKFDRTLGFDSALNQITNAIDNILDCTASFGTVPIVKIMGRDCSDLTLMTAKIFNTKYIIENKDDLVEVSKKINKDKSEKMLVVLKEKTISMEECCDFLTKNTKKLYKPQELGYIQRGGRPSAFDRWYAVELGKIAVDCCLKGKSDITIGYIKGELKEITSEMVL